MRFRSIAFIFSFLLSPFTVETIHADTETPGRHRIETVHIALTPVETRKFKISDPQKVYDSSFASLFGSTQNQRTSWQDVLGDVSHLMTGSYCSSVYIFRNEIYTTGLLMKLQFTALGLGVSLNSYDSYRDGNSWMFKKMGNLFNRFSKQIINRAHSACNYYDAGHAISLKALKLTPLTLTKEKLASPETIYSLDGKALSSDEIEEGGTYYQIAPYTVFLPKNGGGSSQRITGSRTFPLTCS